MEQRYIPRVATLTATHGRDFIRMGRLLGHTDPEGFQGGGDAKVGSWMEIRHLCKERSNPGRAAHILRIPIGAIRGQKFVVFPRKFRFRVRHSPAPLYEFIVLPPMTSAAYPRRPMVNQGMLKGEALKVACSGRETSSVLGGWLWVHP